MSAIQKTLKRMVRKWTTKDGLLGDYDYKYLFTPDIPFITKELKTQPFFELIPICQYY